MLTLKYFQTIEAAQAKARSEGADLANPFDLTALGADTWWSRWEHKAFTFAMTAGFYGLRKFWPIAKIGRLLIVSRAADVRTVLKDREHFAVPFELEMTELAGGETFVLGLDDAAHDRQRAIIASVMERNDLEAMRVKARSTTQALIANSRGRIDIVKDLYARVSAEVCLTYFGLTTADPDAFADWLFSISAVLFADPFGSADTRALALKGSAGVRGVIERALALPPAELDDATLLGRLRQKQKAEPELTDAKIKAIFVGLATGLVPTTTLAAGKLIEQLLARPDELRLAIELSASGKMDALQTLLFEAARLNSALSPGLWRYCRKATTLGKTVVAEGTVVLVGTASALVDDAEIPDPYAFRTDRPPTSFDLAFGMDWHECMGKWVAMALITEITAIVLKQPGFKRAPGRDGQMGWVGAFPRRLDVVFDAPAAPAGFAMVTVAAPLAPGADAEKIKAALVALGNPAPDPVKDAIEQAGTIHFVAASVLEFGDAAKPAPHLVIEINADGDDMQALAATARALGPTLGPIVSEATQIRASFHDTMLRYKIDLKTRPFGAIGLNFAGLAEFSVRDIDRQSRLADFAREAVGVYQQAHLGSGGRALDALEFVRGLIRLTAATRAAVAADASGQLADLARRGQAFADDLLLPSRRRLAMMDWEEPSLSQALSALVKDPADLTFTKAAVAVLFFAAALWSFFRFPAPHAGSWALDGALWVLVALSALALGALITGVIVALLLGGAILWLRRLETRDQPDNREPSLATIRAAAAVEDSPGYAQNHFTSVSDLKPGLFRKMTLAASLWGIKELVTRLYRPGLVINLGTIHFARWFRPPGADKLVFFSNFDGSWHAYLEDFITKAHAGQSAAWSNGVGFPRTRFLVLDGAEDGDSFKRWVRRQQVVTQFWRPRFPDLSAGVKRANALIHFGLARSADESEARDWLGQFGSIARPEGVVEIDEAQAILFRSFGHLPEGEFVALKFPQDPSRLQSWLAGLAGRAEGSGLGLRFGDYPGNPEIADRTAAIVSFSPSGLIKAGFPPGADGGPSTQFPSAFNLGMAARRKVLGDLEPDIAGWRWSDTADAMLIVFGASREATEQCVARHLAVLGPEAALHRVRSTPTHKGIGYEPFGFRDGISQPVIKGTRRHAKGAPDRDLCEAGEFILGYRNSGGYYAPSPAMPAQYDLFNRLPARQTEARTVVPKLDASTALRDFGRNGSFLAVRQIAQDVAGFNAEAERLATELPRKAEVERVIGEPITPSWVQAKMMGRRQEGQPLVDRNSVLAEGERPDNDFDYASDDPEGLRCPIGAHVRRANPRASLGHDDPQSQTIVNRHRILRRGRPYRYTNPAGEDEQGLMFVAVCADLERQFEFVQQTWLNAPNFEELRDEPDPIAGRASGLNSPPRFTVPTAFGPLCFSDLQSFVAIKGGGYFFLPSRSALLFLADALGVQLRGGATAAPAARLARE